MKLVIEGVLDQQLPWGFVAIGIGIALACELLRIPSLPFAVGVYLPVSTMTPRMMKTSGTQIGTRSTSAATIHSVSSVIRSPAMSNRAPKRLVSLRLRAM